MSLESIKKAIAEENTITPEEVRAFLAKNYNPKIDPEALSNGKSDPVFPVARKMSFPNSNQPYISQQ